MYGHGLFGIGITTYLDLGGATVPSLNHAGFYIAIADTVVAFHTNLWRFDYGVRGDMRTAIRVRWSMDKPPEANLEYIMEYRQEIAS